MQLSRRVQGWILLGNGWLFFFLGGSALVDTAKTAAPVASRVSKLFLLPAGEVAEPPAEGVVAELVRCLGCAYIALSLLGFRALVAPPRSKRDAAWAYAAFHGITGALFVRLMVVTESARACSCYAVTTRPLISRKKARSSYNSVTQKCKK